MASALTKTVKAVKSFTPKVSSIPGAKSCNRIFSRWFLEYSKGYNVKVHGPYYRWRNYTGVKSFWDLKPSEVPRWLMQRDCSPIGIHHTLRRYYFVYHERYVNVKNPGLRSFLFVYAIANIMCLPIAQYQFMLHNLAKYH